MSNNAGALYIVATPIGNLQDLSPRAREVLAAVDLIIAEDTRHSHRLLGHLGIKTPVKAYHDHNERQQTPKLIELLQQGSEIALISDAGTPLVSDPGYHLVRAAHEHHIRVTPVPGASAIIAALSAAGLPTDRFVFEGYLPAKHAARLKALQALQTEARTLIFLEAPHRILDCLKDAIEAFGPDRPAAIGREISKLHEDIKRSDLSGLLEWLLQHNEKLRGEFVLLIQGCPETKGDEVWAKQVLISLKQEMPTKKAVELAAVITGLKRNRLYELALDDERTEPE